MDILNSFKKKKNSQSAISQSLLWLQFWSVWCSECLFSITLGEKRKTCHKIMINDQRWYSNKQQQNCPDKQMTKTESKSTTKYFLFTDVFCVATANNPKELSITLWCSIWKHIFLYGNNCDDRFFCNLLMIHCCEYALHQLRREWWCESAAWKVTIRLKMWKSFSRKCCLP